MLHCDGSKAKRIDTWSRFYCSFFHSYGLRAMTNVVFHSKAMYIWMKNEKWKRSREKWEKCRDMNWIAIIINGIVNCWYIFSNSLCLFSVLYFLSLQTVCSFIWIFCTFSSFSLCVCSQYKLSTHQKQRAFFFSSFTLVLVGYFLGDYFFNFPIRSVFFFSLNFFRSIACDCRRETYVISFQCIFGCLSLLLYRASHLKRKIHLKTNTWKNVRETIYRTSMSKMKNENRTETAKIRKYREMNEINGNNKRAKITPEYNATI